MGNRLSKIITRTGDAGTTGLADGSRVAKDTARIEAIGAVDELNSTIGLLRAVPDLPASVSRILLRIQHDLFDLGGELSIPGARSLDAALVAKLEADVQNFNATLPSLKEFILPGGGEATARCHLARAIARRAERRCWTVVGPGSTGNASLMYLNRLSDLLFVLARVLAIHEADEEIYWNRDRLLDD
jgi:cob(I)alamin adenosyltransferase